jgi:hypothetical protein
MNSDKNGVKITDHGKFPGKSDTLRVKNFLRRRTNGEKRRIA